MFSVFEWMVALRYLRARRAEGFISVIAGFSLLGIALGVATLIVVLSVMNGFRAELLGRILGLNGHILVQGISAPLEDYDDLAARIATVGGVVRASPIIEGQVMATSRFSASGALVRGMRQEDMKGHEILAKGIVAGSIETLDARNDIVIGRRLANRLGIGVGDPATLISPQGTSTPVGTVPRSKTYRVAALFDVGMFEYDSTFIFMPLEAAQIYFRQRESVSAIEVILEDPDKVNLARENLFPLTSGRERLSDWQQVNSSYFTALQVERNVMFLILTLIILVAAFNIISSLIMLVKDKGRDIAILRTMGATRGSVMRIFFLAGASIGVVGTFTGLALGVAFADNIATLQGWLEGLTGTDLFAAEVYFLSQLPAKIDWSEVTIVVSMGLGLSLLATIYPSWRAARLDPVEALRYE
ncbi:MAG: lipoprotein-releasing ABC transporter permease subunit [Alphaproteobacteria bacterium]|nr:lipoprotein-releasing ABC transporter permease subunit [Alphaproteobacteria bacterium]